MKPLLLTLQAFGPYAGQEVIDFRPAMDCGLFGIYGTTGSGKSTLFSGITFCLFGEAANADQEQTSLRSHHSGPGIPTRAELIFAVGAKQYLVRRWPTQLRPKKTGEGFVSERHKAELFDVTGMNISDISETNSGRVIKETKAKEVDAAIEAILGYGPRQFKQIVLLPQGQFETFLTAKTTDRITILRELFDVSLYRAMADEMQDLAKAAEDSVKNDRRLCAELLKTKGFETTEELEIGIEDAQSDHIGKLALAQEASNTAQSHQAAKAAAEQIMVSIEALDQARSVVSQLEEAEAAINQVRVNKAQAENARLLLGAEGELTRSKERLSAATRSVSDCNAAALEANKALKLQQAALSQFEQNAEKYEENKVSLSHIRQHEQRLQTAETHQNDHARTKIKVDADASNLSRHDAQTNTLQQQLTAKRSLLTLEMEKDIKIAGLRTKSAEINTALQAANSYEDFQAEATRLASDVTALSASVTTAKSHAATCLTRFQRAEKNLTQIQALILAKKLVDGEACSVCGSKEHPEPAAGTPERQGLHDEFEQAEKALKKADNQLSGLTAKLGSKRSDHAQKHEALLKLTPPGESAASLTQQLSGLQQTLNSIEKVTTPADIQNAISRMETDFAGHASTKTDLINALEASRRELQRAENAQQIALSEVPEHLRDREILQTQLTELTRSIAQYETGLQAAQEGVSGAEKLAALNQERLQAANARLTEATGEAEAAGHAWHEKLGEFQMTAENFIIWKTHIPHIETYAAQINAHDTKLTHARGQITSLEAATADKEKPDLDALKKAAETTATIAASTNREATLAEAHHKNLLSLKDNIRVQLERIAQMQIDAGPVKNLAAAFTGTLGPKMTLEIFAIAAMFDRVLLSANARLLPMSKGRYSLERETSGKGSAKRGLGIKVFDVETGTQRATATLSGGEKFIAALALALGLSDVVESLSGNIRLDTIFIDEGFGSLDAKDEAGTLGDVLQTLTKLVGANRSVGLISHVEIVKQEIPNGFYIHRQSDGSSAIETKHF